MTTNIFITEFTKIIRFLKHRIFLIHGWELIDSGYIGDPTLKTVGKYYECNYCGKRYIMITGGPQIEKLKNKIKNDADI